MAGSHPARTYTDTDGVGWLVMPDGSKVQLPAPGGMDTGWREVSSLLINSFGGQLLLRRTGSMVTLGLHKVTRAADVTAAGVVISPTAPTGFSISNQISDFMLTATHLFDPYASVLRANSVLFCAGSGTWLLVSTWPANAQIYHTFVYPTNDAWPTSLPGTPA